jgi:hypothetical protein
MAASKLNKGWSLCTIGGTTVVHVHSVAFGKGGQLLPYNGDASIIATAVAVHTSHPHASVATADLAVAQGFDVGDAGSIVATTPDALAQAGGNLTFTLSNGYVQNVDINGQWGAYGQATITVMAIAPDGLTPPLSVTAA